MEYLKTVLGKSADITDDIVLYYVRGYLEGILKYTDTKTVDILIKNIKSIYDELDDYIKGKEK